MDEISKIRIQTISIFLSAKIFQFYFERIFIKDAVVDSHWLFSINVIGPNYIEKSG